MYPPIIQNRLILHSVRNAKDPDDVPRMQYSSGGKGAATSERITHVKKSNPKLLVLTKQQALQSPVHLANSISLSIDVFPSELPPALN